jgi:hypothetical protein
VGSGGVLAEAHFSRRCLAPGIENPQIIIPLLLLVTRFNTSHTCFRSFLKKSERERERDN